MSTVASLDAFLTKIAQRDAHQPEFLQAVREVHFNLAVLGEKSKISR